ncbi:DNA damage-regulated autophagy modulator protein 1 isoform X2 [Bombina bombina]|uniref:DNA damage-regulated autophagy modulator protein 1 isoform X2 n=1 Tax=Bombina bombina TaxID=8345 RepID=UPI00235AF91B|nr:DNA damage-regulated autophagy modulator protein 1 isoform X2 [Bombina bombina]
MPFCSDTGTTPPESGVFGFMISVSAMLGAATMYARYKILAKQNDISSFIKPWLNKAALVIGLIGCIGMGIVATFQEKLIPIVHDVGALITFIGGVVYIVLQSVISYMCRTQWNSMRMCCVRISISVISAIAVLPMIVFGALIGITNSYLDPHEQGYRYHMVSAICEWIIAFSFNMYFLTFIKDFQGVTLKITTEIHDDFR